MTKKEILGLTLEQMQDEFLALGLKKFRAEQVFRWIYEKGATTFEEMTNLSKENRSLLEGTYSILSGAVKVLRTYDSADRLTHKVLLGLSDGASVETVLMHHDYGYSACLSSQVGCAMNCTFCAIPFDSSSTRRFHHDAMSNRSNHTRRRRTASARDSPLSRAKKSACSPTFIFL